MKTNSIITNRNETEKGNILVASPHDAQMSFTSFSTYLRTL